ASVLGEVVHPQNFNTLRRIMEEDRRVIEEQEQFAELASNEFLIQQLRALLESGAKTMLEELPDGIHSGLARKNEKGIFFYFTAPSEKGEGRRHFWRYYDLNSGRILDNRFLITNLIACSPDTPRVVGDVNVFEIQEKVLDAAFTQFANVDVGNDSRRAASAFRPSQAEAQDNPSSITSFTASSLITRRAEFHGFYPWVNGNS
ncbi:MAG: hypothetical protein V1724_00895, partial [Chloroflexota bacterium]